MHYLKQIFTRSTSNDLNLQLLDKSFNYYQTLSTMKNEMQINTQSAQIENKKRKFKDRL